MPICHGSNNSSGRAWGNTERDAASGEVAMRICSVTVFQLNLAGQSIVIFCLPSYVGVFISGPI